MTESYVLIQIAVMAAVTLLDRALPFLLFPAGKKLPKVIGYLSKTLPHAVMGMLVVYCLRNVSPLTFPYGLPELIAVAVTAALHWWKQNVLLSLAAGTGVYMILIHTVFAAG